MKGISPTPIELAMGRIMRAPDHPAAGGEGGNDGGSNEAGGGEGEGDADGGSLVGNAADAGAGGEGDAGDGKVPDGEGNSGEDGENGDGKDEPDGDGASDDAADDQVPEAYKLEPITIGEGDAAQTVEIDTKLLEDVTPLLKEAGVTQGAAKKLAPAVLKVQEQVLTRLNNDHAALRADWEKQVREDKTLGGAKLDETMSRVARALDKFGAPSVKDKDGKETNEFRLLMNETGLGNHPVMVKILSEAGKLVGEDDKLIREDTSPSVKQDRLEVLYPNDVPKK